MYHSMIAPWRYILISGLTLLPASNPTRPNLNKADSLYTDNEKIVYVGATLDNVPHSSDETKFRLGQFLSMLHRMPNLHVKQLAPDSTLDNRSVFYPEDPIIGLPDKQFSLPNVASTGETHHGNAYDLFKALKKDGYKIHTNLGIDIDGGDILYDARKGIFLIGGDSTNAQTRADAFSKATGHYAVPVVMTKCFADYTVPNPSGPPQSPSLFYHLDTFANILPNGELLLFPDATDATSLANLKKLYGTRYIPLDAEDASRYASNLISSIDANGKAHLLLPSVSHELPFQDHVSLRSKLSARGYVVHSPEQKGYAEPHAYPVNLFDNSSDFPRNLQQFVDLLLDAPFVPDIVTLKSWAKQIGMELEQDNSMLVLRDAEGRLSALPAKAGSPLDEASCKAISKLQTMLQLNSEWRKGSISKEAIVKAVYPGASQDDLEIVSIFDNLPYYVSPDTKHAATPYIFSGGGPDCMTLEVLNGPSPQQRITALLKAVPTEAEKTEAHAIAKAAGFQIRFKLASFQMIYPNGVAQELRYGKAFEENTLSQFSLQTGATR